MPLSQNQKDRIYELLSKKLDSKLATYARESTSMPFLVAIMQDKEQVAAYSFIHSLSTTLGISVYEDVSKIIAEEHSEFCAIRHDMGGTVSPSQKTTIDNILRRLRNGEIKSDIDVETKEVLEASRQNGTVQKGNRIADFYMRRDGIDHYFEIKTVKPNIDVFTESKSKLLEWVARTGKPIKVYLAFPYNPYYPEPYTRFTLQGLMTPGRDLLIGEEYWAFIGGASTFTDLLSVFNNVGQTYRERIANKIREVANSHSAPH